jgi:hypothetical protein
MQMLDIAVGSTAVPFFPMHGGGSLLTMFHSEHFASELVVG